MKLEKEQTRRDFFKKMSFMSGAAAFISMAPWLNYINPASAKGNTSPSDKVRLAVIGVGKRGKKLLLHLKEITNVEIVAVCDNYKPHLERAKKLAGSDVKGFLDYRKVLELNDLDGIIIATPVYLHPQMTIDGLSAGKHVFCEKSMGITLDGCKKMLDAQQESGKNLQIGHQRMFDLKYLKALDMVKSGKFGPITHIRANWHLNASWRVDAPQHLDDQFNWRIKKKHSLGLMTELASHQTQVANWFLGEFPESVSGFGSINHWKDGRDTFDNVHTVYSYPGGAHFEFSSILSNWHYGLEEQVMGPKATMELETGKFYLQSPPPAPGIEQLITSIEKGIFETIPVGGASWIINTGSTQKGEMIIDEYPLPDSTGLSLEAFAESIKRGRQIPDILEQGYYASVTAILGHQAMEQKKTLKLPEEYRIRKHLYSEKS